MGKIASSCKATKSSSDRKDANSSESKPATEDKPGKSVGGLFQEFINFYATDFDWHNEAVSVRSGKRARPELSLPLHTVLDEASGTSVTGPSVEDPFEISHNLADSMNSSSLARLHEEFARAHRLCSQNASLTELLQPWEPERELDDDMKEEEEKDKQAEGVAKSTIKTSSQITQTQTVPPRFVAPRSKAEDVKAPSSSAPAKTPPWRSARLAAA
jgi:DNA polymerase sigma